MSSDNDRVIGLAYVALLAIRLRCWVGWHAWQPWALPEDVQRRMLSDGWLYSSVQCVDCKRVSVRAKLKIDEGVAGG